MNFISVSERLGDYLKDPKWGLASNLCNWPEDKRVKSLKQTFKLIHQLWTLKVVHEALGAVKVENNRWSIEQGKKRPASTFIDEDGNYWSCWFEPQIITEKPQGYKGPTTPIFPETVWKRPDLIIARGKCEKLVDAPKFQFLIECKDLPFNEWWGDGAVIHDQLRPYKTLFNPEKLILASLDPVPDWAKEVLRREGWLVIDNFYPKGKGVPKFREIIG